MFVHPWAEEMNKSRRMVRLQSRALAAAGFAVLQIDLYGCGDSSGDFGDADWSHWIDDVVRAAAWLRERYDAPLWLWGLRGGCLLASAAAATMAESPHLLFWQPAAAGRALLQQFLRLRAASQLQDGGSKALMAALRADLAAGRTVDVAGYRLPAGLALGLENARLELPPRPGHVEVIEIATRDDAELLPATRQWVDPWQAAGALVRTRVVQGPAFWQTTEIEDAPALIPATVAALREGARA